LALEQLSQLFLNFEEGVCWADAVAVDMSGAGAERQEKEDLRGRNGSFST
jgi:hypothetical protein